MKTAYRTQYGPSKVLSIREVEKPVPKADEILVKVEACTVNRTDDGLMKAKPPIARLFTGLFRPKVKVTGSDFAGTVEAIGEKVSRFKVGDRVFGFNDMVGSHAQYLTIKEDLTVGHIPENISFDQATASIEGGHYAYFDIMKVPLQPGDKVLVNGATGAIGSAAVQILKHLGMKVTAVGNTKNLELVKSLGAERVLNYETEDFTKIDEQFVFIFDAVGKSTFGKCKWLLTPKGTYISTELGPWSQNPFLVLVTPLLGGKKVLFPLPLESKSSLVFIQGILEKGAFRPVIDRIYPLEKIREAFDYVGSGQKTGNVILHPWE